MASWAKVLKAPAPPVVAEDLAPPSTDPTCIAIADANAIINGVRFERIATAVVTISEVMDEIRDKQSRQFLATLPFGIEIKEPTEESVNAVLRFARETGDIHALSSADVKLLALAHTLEVAAHGSAHIREHPVQAKVKAHARKTGRNLPGWGRVTNPEDWKVVDDAEDEAGRGAGANSRIVSQLQPLDHAGEDGNVAAHPTAAVDAAHTPSAPPPTPAATSSADGSAVGVGPAGASAASATEGGLPSLSATVASPSSNKAAEAGAPSTSTSAVEEGMLASAHGAAAAAGAGSQGEVHAVQGEEEEEEEDEWAVAGKSRNSERKQKRKQTRWDAKQYAAAEASGDLVAGAPRKLAPLTAAPTSTSAAVAAAEAALVMAEEEKEEAEQAAAAAAAGQSAGDGGDVGTAERVAATGEVPGDIAEGDEEEDEDSAEDEEGEEEEDDDDDEIEEGDVEEEEGTSNAGGSEVGTDATAADELHVNTTSSVVSVTGDFAMQNVLLQMGLRLISKEGQQITRLSRWALRCHACFHVTKEQGPTKMFCPRCGNMTMERVEVTVGPDGAEFFGVRRKHCLKGTRFSLPKPKGGRGSSSNPILSEDMMLLRMGKKLRRKAKAEEQDPFAPEMGSDSWFKTQQAINGGKGTQYMLTNWKNNPNERTNRSRG